MKALHPLVEDFFEELATQRACDPKLTVRAVTDAAVLAENSTRNWKNGHTPSVASLDKAFRVLGYRLAVVPLAAE